MELNVSSIKPKGFFMKTYNFIFKMINIFSISLFFHIIARISENIYMYFRYRSTDMYFSGVRRKKFRGVQGYGRRRRGFFGKFSKICKKISWGKFRKFHYLSMFFEKFNKPCVNFSRIWTKTANCLEILRKLWKSLMKMQ